MSPTGRRSTLRPAGFGLEREVRAPVFKRWPPDMGGAVAVDPPLTATQLADAWENWAHNLAPETWTALRGNASIRYALLMLCEQARNHEHEVLIDIETVAMLGNDDAVVEYAFEVVARKVLR